MDPITGTIIGVSITVAGSIIVAGINALATLLPSFL